LAIVLGALAAGFLAALPFWPRESAPPSRVEGGDQGATAAGEPWLDEPAYSSEATSEDRKEETIRTVEELLETYPDSLDALNVVARVHYTVAQTNEAARLWERCAEIDPDYADAYYGIGLVALDGGDYEKAARMFERVTALAPCRTKAWSLRGQALLKLGRFEEGVALLENHAQTEEATPEAMVHLGQGYLQLRQYQKAKQTFEAVLQRAPDEAQGYYGLARACAQLGEREKARQCMEKYKKLYSPELELAIRYARAYTGPVTAQGHLSAALLESGEVYRRHGNLAKAEQMWRKAAVVNPKDTRCRLELLSLYEQSGRDRDALKVCEALCRIDPGNPDHWLNVGVLNGRLGRYDAALEAVEQAIRLAPDRPEYQKAYELIQRGK
jgi:tetratricopeptide (TPR) repeat protein